MEKKASLFLTCSADLLYPEAGRAAVSVLEKLGVAVDFPEDQVCCGQPWLNIGDPEGARIMARRYLNSFAGSEAVVAISASCVDTIRNRIPSLFPEGSGEGRAVRALAGRTFEFSEYLHKVLKLSGLPRHPDPKPTTYHVSCRSLRGLGVRAKVEENLEEMLGDSFRPLGDAEACCGFGGSFSVKLPEVSAKIMDDKIDRIVATGALRLVSLDLACMTHLKAGVAKRGLIGLEFLHFAQLLDEVLPECGS